MKSWGFQWRTTDRASGIGVETPICTSTMAVAVSATGAAECIDTHSGQWSAIVSLAWKCATWTTTRRARRARHKTAIVRAILDLAPRFPRSCVVNPVKRSSLNTRIHTIGRTYSRKSFANVALWNLERTPTPDVLIRLNCVR